MAVTGLAVLVTVAAVAIGGVPLLIGLGAASLLALGLLPGTSRRYLIRRMTRVGLTVFVTMGFVWLLVHNYPDDSRQDEPGLVPAMERYGEWLGGLMAGELGSDPVQRDGRGGCEPHHPAVAAAVGLQPGVGAGDLGAGLIGRCSLPGPAPRSGIPSRRHVGAGGAGVRVGRAAGVRLRPRWVRARWTIDRSYRVPTRSLRGAGRRRGAPPALGRSAVVGPGPDHGGQLSGVAPRRAAPATPRRSRRAGPGQGVAAGSHHPGPRAAPGHPQPGRRRWERSRRCCWATS